jgi:putative transposase
MPKRKRIRLPRGYYKGRQWFFVTICCEGRRPLFADDHKAVWVAEQVLLAATEQGYFVHAWCVMPDHLHLLIEGTCDSSDLLAFLMLFKKRTSFEAWRQFRLRIWQRSFYDHRLRDDDSVNRVAWYIWMNPVRKGLCAEPKEYPHSGARDMNWMNSLSPEPSWEPPWKRVTPDGRG